MAHLRDEKRNLNHRRLDITLACVVSESKKYWISSGQINSSPRKCRCQAWQTRSRCDSKAFWAHFSSSKEETMQTFWPEQDLYKHPTVTFRMARQCHTIPDSLFNQTMVSVEHGLAIHCPSRSVGHQRGSFDIREYITSPHGNRILPSWVWVRKSEQQSWFRMDSACS